MTRDDTADAPEFRGTEIQERTYVTDQQTRNLLRRVALGGEKNRLTDGEIGKLVTMWE